MYKETIFETAQEFFESLAGHTSLPEIPPEVYVVLEGDNGVCLSSENHTQPSRLRLEESISQEDMIKEAFKLLGLKVHFT